jgi:hypothetical protein
MRYLKWGSTAALTAILVLWYEARASSTTSARWEFSPRCRAWSRFSSAVAGVDRKP